MLAGRDEKAGRIARTAAKDAVAEVARCVRFYSRVPIGALPWETEPHGLPDFRRMAPAVPLAGLLIGAAPALVLMVALRADFGPWLSAALCVASLTLVTGAFHEDGLADTADGFGGGATPERRLVIMKDSLIGSFGACALILAFGLRIAALATLVDRLHPAQAAALVLVAAVVSRTAGLVPLTLLPPARSDGASYAVGQPTRRALSSAVALAVLLTALLGGASGWPVSGILLMIALPAIASAALTRLSSRLIRGQTGDVAGAVQQSSEVAAMLGLLLATPS